MHRVRVYPAMFLFGPSRLRCIAVIPTPPRIFPGCRVLYVKPVFGRSSVKLCFSMAGRESMHFPGQFPSPELQVPVHFLKSSPHPATACLAQIGCQGCKLQGGWGWRGRYCAITCTHEVKIFVWQQKINRGLGLQPHVHLCLLIQGKPDNNRGKKNPPSGQTFTLGITAATRPQQYQCGVGWAQLEQSLHIMD